MKGSKGFKTKTLQLAFHSLEVGDYVVYGEVDFQDYVHVFKEIIEKDPAGSDSDDQESDDPNEPDSDEP